ncbi:MAG: hypothetical protein ABIE70_09795 [bacterium]
MNRSTLLWAVSTVIACSVADAGWSQSLLPPIEAKRAVDLEFLHPDRDHYPDKTTAGIWTVGYRTQLGTSTALRGELPMTRFEGGRHSGIWDSRTPVGAPYVGVELGRPGGTITELGIRLPFAEEDGQAQLYGAQTDPMRIEAVASDVLGLITRWRIRSANKVFDPILTIGFKMFLPVSAGRDAELIGDYGVSYVHSTRSWSFMTGLRGTIALSTGGSIGERTMHEFASAVRLRYHNFLPVLQLRVPLDDNVGRYVKAVYGFGLIVILD